MDTIQSRRAQHRAAIRSAVIAAALDLDDMRWEPQDDALLDVVDSWLGKLELQATALENARPVYAVGDYEQQADRANRLPKAATLDDDAPLPGFLLRDRDTHRKPAGKYGGDDDISTS